MAGSAKFAFRFLEDPRFADRRMQNLLRKLSDHFSKYNASQVSTLLYCTVKLRFPEDLILKSSVNYITDNLSSFSSRDTALTLWALARMNYPSKHMQMLLLNKVTQQVSRCLKGESQFGDKQRGQENKVIADEESEGESDQEE